ncbi:N-acetyltransferase family protein (plasmid) [Arthrobacter sp. FW306-05-C]|uniref:GNAT family N-acetyltransferase n=2 Tax=Micrococcales TaxID=85006 RepID=UPI001F3F8968|nr:GNAT family N-acetyltransferase [Arthrobacter sp. FW306-05-C]UKA69114.1 N-acetyltransferase family protein [Arthrobacter sp. FW306-05-C]
MRQEHWPEVRDIFQEGIDTGHATFESVAPDWDRFDTSRLPQHRLVAATAHGAIVGWAAVSPVSARPVYSGVVEHSVYVASTARGLGIGKALLEALIRSTERDGIWTVQASVFPENESSLKLHLSKSFVIVGRRRRIARMNHGPLNGQWRDTLLIEHRSPSILTNPPRSWRAT